ncbi:threonine-phosphate decarboxylase CobD [Acuticoccus mangrovi]|uniref:threonine-phosphate decarboxylase CobD n=1 Tax=Acuticoccus mangrovi TaxID=2796142 RepID=UPI002FCC14DB
MSVSHGGDLAEARHLAGGKAVLDLSTGINPHAYPATVPLDAMTGLPQSEMLAGCLAAAREAYRVPASAAIAAAPGTQAILQWLPRLFSARRVAVVGPTYGEHAATWRRCAEVVEVPDLAAAEGADVAVVVTPNNPDGRRTPAAEIAAFAAATGARVIVDEAFGDLDPAATAAGRPGTLVLKSFGKFYGLAGLRLGFAIGDAADIATLADALGPWAVSGPALAVGRAALADAAWAAAMRRRLAEERIALDGALAAAGLAVVGGTDLFRLVETDQAAAWHHRLAERGIWTRRFTEAPDRLRFGLPGAALPRLAQSLLATRAALGV